MFKTFDYRMDKGATAETVYRRNKTQFGDGYAQYAFTGINNKVTNWSGTKTGDLETVIKPIKAFLDEHAGFKPFLWEDPHGEIKHYICAGYNTPQRKGNYWQILLKFEQFTSV